MIVVKLVGGLGNQMFEYAAAKGLSTKLGVELRMDKSGLGQDSPGGTTRHYELGSFKLQQNFMETKPLLVSGSLGGRVEAIIAPLLGRITLKHYREPYYHYCADLLALPDDTYLDGYFQSEKYFAHIREELIRDFTWVKLATGKNKKLLDIINSDENSVSIHVRRGDYISNKSAAHFHGLKGVDYYHAATKIIEKSVNSPNYYVFSDDPDWCKESLKFNHRTIFIDWNSDGVEDMRLMRSCRHNVLANSSFSWWGAWLNTNNNKIVVAPKYWFNDASINTSDVTPMSWQRI